ncbi:hypothetical protein [Promicromonospora sp. NPDC050262]|uniref:hypothetical protein n=1 Tax=Promicromonospora sp. NPDC050262 TaxID=3155036 RepID=UPI0033C78723
MPVLHIDGAGREIRPGDRIVTYIKIDGRTVTTEGTVVSLTQLKRGRYVVGSTVRARVPGLGPGVHSLNSRDVRKP